MNVKRIGLLFVVLGFAVSLLLVGPQLALADCCTCTTQYGNGNFCGPTDSVTCTDNFSPDVNCAGSQVIVGGTCDNGPGLGTDNTGSTCVGPAPTATPTDTPTATATATATTTQTPTATLIPFGDPCTTNAQCGSGVCHGGVCVQPTPAASSHALFTLIILLAGIGGFYLLRRRAPR